MSGDASSWAGGGGTGGGPRKEREDFAKISQRFLSDLLLGESLRGLCALARTRSLSLQLHEVGVEFELVERSAACQN
jgi:hypothetical protein